MRQLLFLILSKMVICTASAQAFEIKKIFNCSSLKDLTAIAAEFETSQVRGLSRPEMPLPAAYGNREDCMQRVHEIIELHQIREWKAKSPMKKECLQVLLDREADLIYAQSER